MSRLDTRLPVRFRTSALAAVAAACLLSVAACSGGDGGGGDAPEDVAGIDLKVLPQIAAAGADPEPAADASYVVEATIEGAKKGQQVELQSKDGGDWKTVEEAKTDDQGFVSFVSPVSKDARVLSTSDGKDLSEEVNFASVGAPLFDDEFDKSSGKWFTRDQGYHGVRMCSRADGSALEWVDGVLKLSVIDDPEKDKCTYKNKQFDYRLNGHVGTQGAFDFLYGTAAARIKFQPGRGQHGSFWMQSAQPGEEGPEVSGAEIDIIEYFGDNHPQGGLTSFVYYQPKGGKPTTVGSWIENPDKYGSDWSSKYHVFSVEWTPEEYIFRIDGKITRRITEGVSGARQFLILSLLSSDYELAKLEGELPQTMDVDWVRVWPGKS